VPEKAEEPKTADPYNDSFNQKVGSETFKFMELEKQLAEEKSDPFGDPNLVPTYLQSKDAKPQGEQTGSYKQAFQQKKLEQIQSDVSKQKGRASIGYGQSKGKPEAMLQVSGGATDRTMTS